ncbi:MAG TPA: hypothetical protein VG890_12865 [Puia sp.]|nr:hypothetical protein [Puia sp.]
MKRRNFLRNTAGLGLGVLPGVHYRDLAASFFHAKEKGSPSSFYKAVCNETQPAFGFFSIDSLGKNALAANILLPAETGEPCRLVRAATEVRYYSHRSETDELWTLQFQETSFTISARYVEGDQRPFVFPISQVANHATLLGRLSEKGDGVLLPAVLHFPDMGTLRVSCNVPGTVLGYDAKRFIDHPYVRISFPGATEQVRKRTYRFEVVQIHPDIKGIEQDPRYDCFRRNFISIFQLNPVLKILANNSASDACAFTLFTYAAVALQTPQLAPELTALDLVRETLDRYLAGQLGYGQLGYDYDKKHDIPESPEHCNTLDTYPSLLIAASYYTSGSGDNAWFNSNYAGIKNWAGKMLATDSNQDGLLEFCLSGNSGSWKGDYTMRPANWWDTIGFGHQDAYSNALAYHALNELAVATDRSGNSKDAVFYRSKAAQLKSAYVKTFYNPATGVLAGWRSADGHLHDYYFTFVNSIAICYGLVEPDLANHIMDKLLQKMDEVGFHDFGLGLPGNLIPVIRADYTDLNPEVGGGKREDNLDGFQIYENGGATACYTYYTIRALQLLGRKKDADRILLPLLESMSAGNFQGRCANGKTKDWKTWSGECWGYEGFLVDNYMFLLTVLTR